MSEAHQGHEKPQEPRLYSLFNGCIWQEISPSRIMRAKRLALSRLAVYWPADWLNGLNGCKTVPLWRLLRSSHSSRPKSKVWDSGPPSFRNQRDGTPGKGLSQASAK